MYTSPFVVFRLFFPMNGAKLFPFPRFSALRLPEYRRARLYRQENNRPRRVRSTLRHI